MTEFNRHTQSDCNLQQVDIAHTLHRGFRQRQCTNDHSAFSRFVLHRSHLQCFQHLPR